MEPIKTPYQLLIMNRIVKVRKDNHYSQVMVAELLHRSNGFIGNCESANRSHKYTLGQLTAMCKKFGYPLSMILLDKPECSNEELIDAIVNYEEGI